MKKEKIIKVLKVAPGENPEVVELANNLDAVQKAVSIGMEGQGLIEIIELDEETVLLANEEGKVLNLPPNRRLGGNDIIAGVFYVTGQNKYGDLASLSEAGIEKYSKMFEEIPDISESEVFKSMVMRFFAY